MSDTDLILRADETVGEPFQIDGKNQILVLMPNGASWGGRTVELQAMSCHPGDTEYWFTLNDPASSDQLIRWDREGFIAVDGVGGFWYRLTTTDAGPEASIHPVKTWTRSGPGR